MDAFNIGIEDEHWVQNKSFYSSAGDQLVVVVNLNQLLFLVELHGQWVKVRTTEHQHEVGMVPIEQGEISRTTSPDGILARLYRMPPK